jgi:hypothetical protein
MTIGMNNLGSNGRLGNQMFQYASLVGIAKNKGYDFRIPETCDLVRCFDMLHCGDRYGLIDGDEVELHDSHEFCKELFDECPNHVTLNGYFQTEKYFKNAEKLIRLDFRFKKEIQEEVDQYYGEYFPQRPVSISIRHYNDTFDYPGCDKNHRNIPIEYYHKAIEILGKDKLYIISSNSIELYKKHFIGDNFIFNDVQTQNEKGFFDLCLSANCDNFIISNSTFSWWGAWLGNRGRHPISTMPVGGRVIAPTPWYGPGHAHINTNDLYPNGWEKIKC